MKKLIPLLLVFAAMQALAQKSRVDSLLAMPQKLFAKGNILNCTVLGYRKAYVYRFMFSGASKQIKAQLKHEMGERDGYTGTVANLAFNKSWYYSKDVATYLQDWTFDILPSHDTFKLSSWMAGVNPNGATDQMYTQLPGGHFPITKGLDTADYRHWKIFMGTTPITVDSVSVQFYTLPVSFDQSVKEELYDAKNRMHFTVYTFWSKTEYVGIARWGDLFFPFNYGYRNKNEPQFRLSSMQVGFDM